jgi:hypothetical protein
MTTSIKRTIQNQIVSGATRRAQLARDIAKDLNLTGHNINRKRVIIDSSDGVFANCIIDGDFDNIVRIKLK